MELDDKELQRLKELVPYKVLAPTPDEIINYITNLQEELKDYKSRIDKAIEYIKNNQWELEENGYEDDWKIDTKNVLEILKGEDKK